ncbi:Macrolide export ATP-binding/permease protein MacB [Caloramator mitchellensis]|uniref:Macrolide export ATP-binding/permease protein MacB n=1 Tax=Caloramator mitchellensis TaxID=908809 RepID=A0A0R3JQV3_CALMK|nr:ABC transporter ATP-binding protein [Caloramator mitchellensis]KRQ85824.1 Macrolide export ATP-binding/permease protein MacB [Caloramator mitchellensis]
MIQLHDIVKVYSTGKIEFEALKGINFTIEKGEYLAIVGPSGSGKSTLMNILGCLDRPTKGKYILNGKDVSNLDDDELARIRNKEIGFVFQAFNLLPRLTALENVELPLIYAGLAYSKRIKLAKEALEKVGLSDRMHHRPNELSGGQKQRVAIARAIVLNPSIVMADEPTGNLDTQSSIDIMKIFQKLNDEGSTIIMVTHEKDIAQHTKREIIIRDGKIIQDNKVLNRTIY